jgi:hypothetical protein
MDGITLSILPHDPRHRIGLAWLRWAARLALFATIPLAGAGAVASIQQIRGED